MLLPYHALCVSPILVPILKSQHTRTLPQTLAPIAIVEPFGSLTWRTAKAANPYLIIPAMILSDPAQKSDIALGHE